MLSRSFFLDLVSSAACGDEESRKAQLAKSDCLEAIRCWRLWVELGWNDVKQRYRRSTIGPFWITITQGVTIGSIGIVYGNLFGQSMDRYLPFLTLGILTFGLISGIITECGTVFTLSESFIKQAPIPKSSLVMRIVWKNLLMFAHNILVYIPVALYFRIPVSFLDCMWALFGLALICFNGFWAGLFLGMVCTRFRDLPPLLISLMQLAFFISPVIWMNDGKNETISLLVALNPLAYFLDLVRSPMLGLPIDLKQLALAVGFSIVCSVVSFKAFARYRARITYWL